MVLATYTVDEGMIFHHSDHIGTSQVVTSGEVRFEDDTDTTNDYFAGHLTDDSLVYMQARYYHPILKRFLSGDPASFTQPQDFLHDPQQMNRYSYARNNPVRYTDPTGEFVVQETNLIVTNKQMRQFVKGRAKLSSSSFLVSFNNLANRLGVNNLWGQTKLDDISLIKSTNSPDASWSHPRYIFTRRAGLVDMRHFFQSMYISRILGENTAIKMTYEHELYTEPSSKFAPEDLISNALGAEFGQQLRGLLITPNSFSRKLYSFIDQLDPIDFSSLNQQQQADIINFYDVSGGLVNQNTTALPKFPGLSNFGFELDNKNLKIK